MITLLILYVGSGLLLSAIAVPLIQRRIPPNPWYGFRVRQTLENREVWYAANAHAGVRLFWAGVAIIIASAALYVVPGLSEDVYAWGCTGVMAAALFVGLGSSWRYLQRVLQEQEKP